MLSLSALADFYKIKSGLLSCSLAFIVCKLCESYSFERERETASFDLLSLERMSLTFALDLSICEHF